jgi:acetolactate synthase-1/2/3 large subunit
MKKVGKTMKKETANNWTVADAVVQELVRAGVEVVFGIVSIHNLPIYDAIKRDGRIHTVTARGESGAVNMADGYARATGKLGVVITSTGTGAGNAAGALVEAWSAGVPLLHLTGEVASPYLGTGRGYIHEMKDQLQMMAGCSKEAFQLRQPEQAVALMKKSIETAWTAPSGPVTLQIPIDFQSAIIPPTTALTAVVKATAAPAQIEIPAEAIDAIQKARRPVIWAGGGVIAANAAAELTQLAEKLGAAVITSQAGKGSIPEDHALCIGHFASYQPVRELLAAADLVLSVGIRFRSNETANWKTRIQSTHISMDADLMAFQRNYPTTYSLVGDAKLILSQLLRQLQFVEFDAHTAYREEVTQLRQQLREQLRATLGPYEKILDALRQQVPKDAIFVRDVTVPANVWGSRLIETYKPRTSIHASGGGIGQGLPTAIGAQMGARNQQVILIAGDGGFMVNVGEMVTATQEELPLIILLFDDRGYGVLRNIQEAAYGRQVAVDLLSPDFVQLGQAMGYRAERITKADDFAAALNTALGSQQPTILVLDMEAIGPMAKPFGGPPGAAEAFRPKKLS